MQPLNARNNNPGNMRGKGGAFQQFATPQAGMQAMANDLLLKIAGNSPAMKARYGDGYQPTLRNLITTWAPPSENDTDNYINTVAKQTGLHPDAALTANDINALIPAMTQMEGGKAASDYFGQGTQYADAGNVASDAVPVNKPDKMKLYLEAEKRGILPANKAPLLAEARKRGLIPALETAQPEGEKGFFDRVSEDIQKRGDQSREAQARHDSGDQSLLATRAIQFGKAGAGTISDIVGEGIKSGFNALPDTLTGPLKDIGVYVAEKAAPIVKPAAEGYKMLQEQYPTSTALLESGLNVATLLPIGKGAKAIGSEAIAPAVTTTGKALDKAGEKMIKSGAAGIEQKRNADIFRKFVIPKETNKVAQDLGTRSKTVGKINPTRTPIPNALESDVVDTLSGLTDNAGEPLLKGNELFHDAYNKLDSANTAKAESLKATLEAADAANPSAAIIPKQQILDTVQQALAPIADKPILGKAGKNRISEAFNEMASMIPKEGTTAADLLEIRKQFDRTVEEFKGSKIHTPVRATAFSKATQAVRKATNDIVAAKYPSAEVADSLKKQFHIYNAMDAIKTKIPGQAASRLGRISKGISDVAATKGAIGTAVGLGGASMAGLPIIPLAAAGAGVYGAGKVITDPRLKKLIGAMLKGSGKAMNGKKPIVKAIKAAKP